MKGFWKLTWVQFKLYMREPIAFFFALLFPVLLLLLFGAAFGDMPAGPTYQGQRFIDYYAPALLALIAGTVGLMSVPVKTASEREYKVLKRFRVAPISPLVYLGADVLMNLLVNLAGAAFTILVGWLVFDLQMPRNPVGVILATFVTALAFAALGYLIAGLAPTARIAQVVGMVIFFPMMFVSGVSLPVELLPDWLRAVSKALPMTHAVNLLQGLWAGAGAADFATAWLVLVGLTLLAGGFGARLFRWE